MEYDSCIKHGGNGFMCCLTYSDDVVPTILLPNGEKKMVFRKSDVINFIKRLRVNLDRSYRKRYNTDAPNFKYLITSEYGTDPTRTHRPHYHCLFFFKSPCVPNVFRKSFIESMYNRKKGLLKYYFGFVKQCDLIDPQKGGIKYSSKYVCKDITYKVQADYIKDQISFYKDMVNNMFSIRKETSAEDAFYNSCVRSTKQYKDAVNSYVTPWRHMQQFYMLSNDLGGSCVVEKYGKELVSMPLLNFDGFPYALPKIVRKRFEEKFGFAESQKLVKSAFSNFLVRGLADLVHANILDKEKMHDLIVFADNYIQPYRGELKLVLPNFDSSLDDVTLFYKDWNDIINEFQFYEDNDFFTMKDELESCLNLINRESAAMFRFKVLQEKNRKQKEEYERKKRTKHV